VKSGASDADVQPGIWGVMRIYLFFIFITSVQNGGEIFVYI
jgi:hypothetical protein